MSCSIERCQRKHAIEDVPSEDVPSEDVPSEDVPSEDVPSEDVPPEYMIIKWNCLLA